MTHEQDPTEENQVGKRLASGVPFRGVRNPSVGGWPKSFARAAIPIYSRYVVYIYIYIERERDTNYI